MADTSDITNFDSELRKRSFRKSKQSKEVLPTDKISIRKASSGSNVSTGKLSARNGKTSRSSSCKSGLSGKISISDEVKKQNDVIELKKEVICLWCMFYLPMNQYQGKL